MESHHGSRPSRLEKQEEFEMEEEGFMLSPVTIQIEDRGQGDNPEDLQCKENIYIFDADDDSSSASGKTTNPDLSPDTMDRLTETKTERRKASSRVKLLVRSQAVHDDASPPPDLETVIANTNMLSVTNASSFGIQTQSKGASNKIRLGHQSSSQGSTESSSASGLSRDSSTETYTDSSGVDLQQFIVDTLHKNQKDRLMLLKIEQELTLLIKDNKRQSQKFPQMSSYNRMLVHRVAAYFGLDHYVDGNGTAVIVNKTKTTRLPDSRFQDFIRDELLPEEPKKSILKRDSISFEDSKEKSPERQSSTDSRRSKSFEEREEEYEKARARIFNQDEGLGESPLNRSQEGTYSSSRRSSQEDIRWPSSETRPWSSTDSDSSGRPLGAKLSSSFETDPNVQSGAKNGRSLAAVGKAESENKALLMPTKAARPAMTKASSFGGISVLSRESPAGKSTPRLTKAESFNVTTICSSPVTVSTDETTELQEETTNAPQSPSTAISSSVAVQPTSPNQFSIATGTADQTFPLVAGQPTEIQVPCIQDSSQQVPNWQSGSHDTSPGDFPGPSAVGGPLLWPYSTAPDVLFPGSVIINPQTGCQRMVFSPYQPLAVASSSQVPAATGHASPGTSASPSSQQPSQRQQQQSPIQAQIQQPQQNVNTSSPPVFYVPYSSQIRSSRTHASSLSLVQTVQRQAQPSQFLNDPRPFIFFPACYMHQSSNIHPVRYAFSPNTAQQTVQTGSQTTGLHGQNVSDAKSHGTASQTNVLSPQYLPGYPALAFTQSGETPSATTTVTTTIYPYGSVLIGSVGSTGQTNFKSPQASQSSQPPVCVQQSVLSMQTPVTLPPVYVSITSSTQTPAAQTHAGGHSSAHFSSFRSQSLPLSSSSTSGVLNHQINSGTPFLGYTVYASPIQGITAQSPLAAVTLSQNTHASATPSQITPAYVTAFQVLQPGVPLVANVGTSTLPSQNIIHSQYPPSLSTVNKVPLSFPLVKQASDPGVGERLAMTNELCLVTPTVQHHLGPLLLPQQPLLRLPRASISGQPPANRPPKTRKQRSKGISNTSASSSTPASQSTFDMAGNHILEIEGLPGDMKPCEVERYLEGVTEHGAKIYFLDADTLEILNNSTDFIVSNKHIVLAVFDSDTAAQNALLGIKTTKFQLRRWHRSKDDEKMKKT